MPDKDKVLKGLTCCAGGACSKCPYNDGSPISICSGKVAKDALNFLKEQNKTINRLSEIVRSDGIDPDALT